VPACNEKLLAAQSNAINAAVVTAEFDQNASSGNLLQAVAREDVRFVDSVLNLNLQATV
jgi:hypothetical protein